MGSDGSGYVEDNSWKLRCPYDEMRYCSREECVAFVVSFDGEGSLPYCNLIRIWLPKEDK